MLINVDLKQIEVIVFAHLCKDNTLTNLLLNGQDIHRFIAGNVYDKAEINITELERSDAKTSTFGIIYGNGARTLSERTGKSFDWAKEFIERFYSLFPKAKEWHKEIQKQVEKTGQLKLFTKEVLRFKKYPAKFAWQLKKGIKESYNPPDIKNYPVQHTAWIITSIILGTFYRDFALAKRDKYLLINTVHDSLMVDSKEEFVDECIEDLIYIVDKVPEIIYTKFNEKIIVPIKCDISIGNNWYDL